MLSQELTKYKSSPYDFVDTNINNKDFALGWVTILGSNKNFGLGKSLGLRCQGVKSLGENFGIWGSAFGVIIEVCCQLNFEIWVLVFWIMFWILHFG